MAVQDVPSLSLIFFPLGLELAIFPRIPGSFSWRMILEIKSWAFGVLIAPRSSLFLGPVS